MEIQNFGASYFQVFVLIQKNILVFIISNYPVISKITKSCLPNISIPYSYSNDSDFSL